MARGQGRSSGGAVPHGGGKTESVKGLRNDGTPGYGRAVVAVRARRPQRRSAVPGMSPAENRTPQAAAAGGPNSLRAPAGTRRTQHTRPPHADTEAPARLTQSKRRQRRPTRSLTARARAPDKGAAATSDLQAAARSLAPPARSSRSLVRRVITTRSYNPIAPPTRSRSLSAEIAHAAGEIVEILSLLS